MQYRIIGSVAAYHWFPDARIPGDIDLLTPAKITGNDSKLCVVDCQWHAAAKLLIEANEDPVFLDPDLLFTLKVSHAHWNVKWDKTMSDIAFLKRKGCRLDFLLYDQLIKVWERVHGPKRVNMARSMSTFFNDAITREHDHEYLHELVAFHGRPLHERLRPDHGTAWCSQELFDALPAEQQLEVALEEMMAVAIERSRLKTSSLKSEKRIAMSRAHFQLCTSMTKGWFARFLILHRTELLHERKEKWLTRMNLALPRL